MHPISPLKERAMIEAYTHLYALVQAHNDDHFLFTSSGAEGVNHAVFSAYLEIARKTGKNHFLCLQTDEAPAIMAMTRLQELGCVFQMVPVDENGQVSRQMIAEMLSPRTAMLSMSHANGLTGVVQPAEEIGHLCRERGVFYHLEVSHTLGKRPLHFEDLGADALSFDGWTPGTGGLYLRSGVELAPLILGGPEQEHLRAGSWNVDAFIEMARYAQQALRLCDQMSVETARLRALFEDTICEKLPDAQVLFQEPERVPNLTTFLFPGVVSEVLGLRLEQKALASSFGGHAQQHLVHILKACGIEEPLCHSGQSFSLMPEEREEQIIQRASGVIEAVQALQKISHHLMENV